MLFAYTDKTPIGEDIDLSTIPLGDLPSVIAGYNVDLASQDFDAAYVATAGTLHLTAACGTNAGHAHRRDVLGRDRRVRRSEIDPTAARSR